MTETTKNTGEKLSVAPTKTLTLKRGGVEQGVVRQSFSHGRSRPSSSRKLNDASPRQSRLGRPNPLAPRIAPPRSSV